uniref:Uncharacterized protein n=1 Tax=Anguilla anguilla TaxID=7936 RepID=A0A0E9PUC0_ANGAN
MFPHFLKSIILLNFSAY